MSWRQWLVLLFLFVTYLLLGSFVFLALEAPQEEGRLQDIQVIRQMIYERILECKDNETAEDRQERENLWQEVAHLINQPSLVRGEIIPKKWTLFNSFFVAVTVTSTIGYGHLAPSTASGRIFTIAFAFIGIPLNGILLGTLGDYFGAKLARRSRKRAKNNKQCSSHLILFMDVVLYMIPGLIVFLAIPAGLFTFVEGWTYVDSFYYAFVSLTTIGFGDLVAGQSSLGSWVWFYRVVIITWIIFGLGYLAMVINIISKGLRSRPVLSLERKVAARLQTTRQKLARDALLLRRLVNEITVMKIKPIYRSEKKAIKRTNSQPSIFEHDIQSAVHSEVKACKSLMKTCLSETDLTNVDLKATFHNLHYQSQENNQDDSRDEDPIKLLTRLATVLCEDVQVLQKDDSDSSSSENINNADIENDVTVPDHGRKISLPRYCIINEDKVSGIHPSMTESPTNEAVCCWMDPRHMDGYSSLRSTLRKRNHSCNYGRVQADSEDCRRSIRSRRSSGAGSRKSSAIRNDFGRSVSESADYENPPNENLCPPARERKKSVVEFCRILDEVHLSRQSSQIFSKENMY